MGKETVSFRCHSCGHCCTDVICLPTPWDVVRIVRETGEHPLDFLEFITDEDIADVDDDDPTWIEVGGRRYLMALKRGKKGCYFLDKKTKYCKIYESRPILCRLFPFKLNETKSGEYKSFTLHKDVGCPKNKDGIVPTKPLYDLYVEDSGHQEDYDALVGVFNRRKDARKPEEFIEMFVTTIYK